MPIEHIVILVSWIVASIIAVAVGGKYQNNLTRVIGFFIVTAPLWMLLYRQEQERSYAKEHCAVTGESWGRHGKQTVYDCSRKK